MAESPALQQTAGTISHKADYCRTPQASQTETVQVIQESTWWEVEKVTLESVSDMMDKGDTITMIMTIQRLQVKFNRTLINCCFGDSCSESCSW